MNQPIKYLLLFLFILNGFTSYNAIAQTDTKYPESMLEINEYLLTNEFNEALPILNDLVNAGYQNANVNYKLGLCYLNSFNDKHKAISYLKAACIGISDTYSADNENETKAPAKALLFLGDAYRYENQFKDAEVAYRKYLNKVISFKTDRELAQKRLEECRFAQILMKSPINATINNLGSTINSGISNFNGCLSGNGSVMVFTRRLKFYDAIFYCTRTSTGWTEPENITTQIGSDGELHPTGLSFDGSRMLLMSFTHLNGYDIFESIKINGKWKKYKVLNTVNSPFNEIDATYSFDGKSIVFSSNRSNGIGGYDIYTSTLDSDEKYSLPINIGATINTIWNEKSPSYYNNSNSLVISSERKPGMGGYDLFYSNKKTDNEWSDMYNVGYPINTIDNDNEFQLKSTGQEGIIAKHDKDGYAEIDIFQVQSEKFSKFRLIPLKGKVMTNGNEAFSTKGSLFYLVDETLNDTLTEFTDADSGKFNTDIYPGNFQLIMTDANKKSISQSFTVPSDLDKPEFNFVSTFTKVPEVAKIQSIDSIEVVDIYFDFDKADILSNQQSILNELITILKNYKISKIELVGYSDSKGSPDYNLLLSAKRAKQVMKYFAESGISDTVITAKGLGSSNFVSINTNPNGTDNLKGRALNRRVEILIVPTIPNVIFTRKNVIPKELRP